MFKSKIIFIIVGIGLLTGVVFVQAQEASLFIDGDRLLWSRWVDDLNRLSDSNKLQSAVAPLMAPDQIVPSLSRPTRNISATPFLAQTWSTTKEFFNNSIEGVKIVARAIGDFFSSDEQGMVVITQPPTTPSANILSVDTSTSEIQNQTQIQPTTTIVREIISAPVSDSQTSSRVSLLESQLALLKSQFNNQINEFSRNFSAIGRINSLGLAGDTNYLIISSPTINSPTISNPAFSGTVTGLSASSGTFDNNVTVGGTISVTGASTLTGNVSMGGTLSVTGNTTLANATSTNSYISGILTVGGNATTTSAGNLSIQGILAAAGTGTSTFAGPLAAGTAGSGNLIVSGATTTGKLLLNPYGGQVLIGTSTVTTNNNDRLVVWGNIFNPATSTPVLVGSVSAITFPYAIDVVGRYAYIVMQDSDTLNIFDLSTSSPAQISSLSFSVPIDPRSVYVSGRYAYIGGANATNNFVIVDISNPRNPAQVFNGFFGTANGDIYSVYVSGRYVYITDADTDTGTSDNFHILDISNQTNPVLLSSVTVENDPRAVFVSGKYAYVATYTNPGEALHKIDISNPTNPVIVGTYDSSDVGDYPINDVYVSGNYAYAASYDGAGSEQGTLLIFDVSSSTPSLIAKSIDLSAKAVKLAVSGRYVYVLGRDTTGNTNDTLQVFDVINPYNPVRVGIAYVVGDPWAIKVMGRYAYVTDITNGLLEVYDISGIETTSAIVHSLEAGTLAVRNNITLGGQLMVGGGLNIGAGGLLSDGPLAVIASTTLDRISASFGNRVSIGTSTPYARLTVWGSGTGTNQLFQLVNNASTSVMTVLDNSNVGIGTTSPYAKLSVVGEIVGAYFTSTTTATSTFAGPIAAATTGIGNFIVSGATTTSKLLLNPYGGQVLIGTSTVTTNNNDRLVVWGNIFNPATSTPSLLGSATTGTAPFSVMVQGRYAYVVTRTSNRLEIYDISTTSPSAVGLVSVGNGTTNPTSVYVAGRYAYTANETTADVSIIDISNPNAPVLVSTTTPTGSGTRQVIVRGRYAYALNLNSIQVFDISNPSAARLVSTFTGLSGSGRGMDISGRYLYVVENTNNTLRKIDISNPEALSEVGSNSSVNDGQVVRVYGRYAYVVSDSAQDNLRIFDISTSTPSLVSTISAGLDPNWVEIAGRYAYVSESASNRIEVFDVSNPVAPVSIGQATTGTSPQSLFVAGRYIYVVNRISNTLQVFDASGLETTSAIVHSLEAGNLQVRGDALIGGRLSITDGLNIGAGGLLSDGPLAVIASTTLDRISASFGNRVSVGTSTPYARLTVWGSGTGTGQLFQLVNNASTSVMTVLDNGRVGIGTTSPMDILSVVGNIAITGCGRDAATGSNITTAPSACVDLAESFPTQDVLEAGEVVMLDEQNPEYVKRAVKDSGRLVGVVSTNPAVVLEGSRTILSGQPYSASSTPGKVPLALAGRVPVKANLEGGDIRIGDPLTISSEDGVAMKSVRSGAILGYALANYSGPTEKNGGRVMMFVKLSYWMPLIEDASPSTTDEQGLIARVINAVVDWLREATVAIRELWVKVLKIGSPSEPAGVTMYDVETGMPYCLYIRNGVTETTSGTCPSFAPITTSAPTSEPAPLNDSPSESSGEHSDSQNVVAEPISEPIPEPVPTEEPTASEPAPEPTPAEEPAPATEEPVATEPASEPVPAEEPAPAPEPAPTE